MLHAQASDFVHHISAITTRPITAPASSKGTNGDALIRPVTIMRIAAAALLKLISYPRVQPEA